MLLIILLRNLFHHCWNQTPEKACPCPWLMPPRFHSVCEFPSPLHLLLVIYDSKRMKCFKISSLFCIVSLEERLFSEMALSFTGNGKMKCLNVCWDLNESSIWQRRRQWHPTPVLLPGKSHGQRSLVGCSPWGRWESDKTERLHFHFSLSCIGEGNGNPLQCSCLENPRDEGAWWAARRLWGRTELDTTEAT